MRFYQIGGLTQADKGVGENYTIETPQFHRPVAGAEKDAVAEKGLDVHVLVELQPPPRFRRSRR